MVYWLGYDWKKWMDKWDLSREQGTGNRAIVTAAQISRRDAIHGVRLDETGLADAMNGVPTAVYRAAAAFDLLPVP